MDQNKIFSESEGDAWFNRNQNDMLSSNQSVDSPDIHCMLNSISPFAHRINRVLEIGCSSGLKLESICSQLDAEGVGIEPSSLAVKAGNERKKNSKIELLVGTGEKLPFDNASFDLVYFAFCLYLFDRNTLVQALSEADRVLKSGGFLVITDFDPGFRYKRTYNHFKGLFSFKQDYSTFYTQSGLYYLVSKHSFSHGGSIFDASPDERVSTSIMYKETDPYPIRG